MHNTAKSIKRLARRFWRGVREWCGDASYDRYLHSLAARPSKTIRTLSAEEFYVEQLNRRYSRPSRCC
jgi:uncharacterized short protein YbdD (DUF466 family)